MVDNTSRRLSDLLGAPFVEADCLYKGIQKILQTNNTDADDNETNSIIIKGRIDKLIKHCYGSLRSIDKTKRVAFWNELNAQLERLPNRCLTEEVQSQMTLLQMVCHFDFAEKPLSFIFEAKRTLDILSECENKLLKLIETLRDKYDVRSVLDPQYISIRNSRRKFVLAVTGGLKSGKSSFINYLLGLDVCPMGICATTARLTKITYGQPELVKLESITGEEKEKYEIQNSGEWKEITERLIALEGSAREGQLCEDIVTIQLNRKELEYIELWDIPGFDENSSLNSIIEDILKKTDIIFILQPLQEGVRKTVVDLFRSCTKNPEFKPQVCFIVTKIDQVTTNPNAENCVEEGLDQIFSAITARFQLEIGTDRKSSPFFIPLCTIPEYLKDFLDSYKQFTEKSKLFLKNAVCNITLDRLKYLIDTIHELFDYGDIDRSIRRHENLSKVLTVYDADLQAQIEAELKGPLIQIHQAISRKFSTITESAYDENIQRALTCEIENQLAVKREQIQNSVTKCVKEYYRKLGENPALTAVILSLEKRALYGDPYQAVIGQYRKEHHVLSNSTESYRTIRAIANISRWIPNWANLKRVRRDLPTAIVVTGLIAGSCIIFPAVSAAITTAAAASAATAAAAADAAAAGGFFAIYWPFSQAATAAAVASTATAAAAAAAAVVVTTAATAAAGGSGMAVVAGPILANVISLGRERRELVIQAKGSIESSVKAILEGLRKDISDHVHQTLSDGLNILSEELNSKVVKMNEQRSIGVAGHISRFLKENNLPIKQLYLNLLDQTNQFTYAYCNINLGTVLGKGNFPVYAGRLACIDRMNGENIAAKRLSLDDFDWQEVRYMTELNHTNILHYYGVRKSPDCEDFYDILMQCLDSDLTTYIDDASRNGKMNDQLIDDIFIQITTGLRYLHEKDLIHRDIKPANVLVQLPVGQSPIFVLGDFGFIHRAPISIKGTDRFLAPELLANNMNGICITAKIDIFSLGATIQQTIDDSQVNSKGKYVTFWREISTRCRLSDPYQRPTCQNILEDRKRV